MNVLVACEESQIITEAYRRKGVKAYSCDIEKCSGNLPQYHLKMDVLIPLSAKRNDGSCYWDLIIAHPPCTYLTNAGVRWLYHDCVTGKAVDRWDKMRKAINFSSCS